MKLITLLKEIALFEISLKAIKDEYVDKNRITPEEYEEIVTASGGKSAYATWLAVRVANKEIANTDIYKYEEYFDLFDKNKQKFPSPDINDYGKGTDGKRKKNSHEISVFIDKAVEVRKDQNKDPSLAKGVSKSEKYSRFKIGEVDGFAVYKIPQGSDDLYNVSCELGSGTEWCTATGKTSRFFDDYIKQGPIYIFDNGKGEKYQFHYESGQFMNKNDISIFG